MKVLSLRTFHPSDTKQQKYPLNTSAVKSAMGNEHTIQERY